MGLNDCHRLALPPTVLIPMTCVQITEKSLSNEAALTPSHSGAFAGSSSCPQSLAPAKGRAGDPGLDQPTVSVAGAQMEMCCRPCWECAACPGKVVDTFSGSVTEGGTSPGCVASSDRGRLRVTVLLSRSEPRGGSGQFPTGKSLGNVVG